MTHQLHDFNAGIAVSGLFWTIPISDQAFQVTGKTAYLHLDDIPVVDSHTFLGSPEETARVTLDVTFTTGGEKHHFHPGSTDPTDPTNLDGEFRFGVATGSFSGDNASGFTFQATGASSAGIFCELGRERNGAFLNSGADGALAAGAAQQGAARSQAADAAISSPGLSLARALPNPTLDGSSLEFTLGSRATVSLAVFDPAGRRVATILDGQELAAGRHAYRWDLRDQSGRRVAPGLYLVSWKSGSEAATARLAVLP